MARPKKDPHIFKVGDYYQGYFSRNDRRSLGTKDYAEAVGKFSKILQDGAYRVVQSAGHHIADLIRITVERSTVSQADKTAYEMGLNLRRIGDWLTELNLIDANSITKDVVEQYKAFRSTGVNAVGNARINREMTNWLRLMKTAKELGAYTKVAKPKEMFEFLPEPKPDPNITIPDMSDLEKFFTALDDRYVPLLRVTLGTGIRAAESRHFTADNLIDAGDNKYQLIITPLPSNSCYCHPKGWMTKNYHYRKIPITKETFVWGQRYLDTRESLNIHKKHNERRIWEEINLACTIANIQHLSLHSFRHAYASHMLNAGFKIAHISKWLGHRNVQITIDRYLHIIETDFPSSSELPF